MPVNIIHIEDGGIIFKCEAVVTGQELKETNKMIYKSTDDIKKILYQIVDTIDASDVSVSRDEMEGIAMLDKKAFEINPHMLIALVANNDLYFGLCRMWESFATDLPTKTMVFRKMEDAQQWIREELQKKSSLFDN